MHLCESLTNLALQLDSWDKTTFGNQFRKRDNLWKRIEDIQRKLYLRMGFLRLRASSKTQKARTDALVDGDRNTRYFHACVVLQRKHNKIESLMDASGQWFWEHGISRIWSQNIYVCYTRRN
ncbi:LOW QUALITY PROTEIN: hypothetical protein V2J09_010788 [Rumex salicifolius]